LTEAIRRACGLEMEVISGDKEADWVFRGVTTNPKLAQSPVLILDVGAAALNSSWGTTRCRNSAAVTTWHSAAAGALRPGDPPGLRALLQARVWLRDF